MPNTKVTIGTLGGAVATVIMWALGQYAHFNPPPEVATAIGVIIVSLVAYITPHQQGAPNG